MTSENSDSSGTSKIPPPPHTLSEKAVLAELSALRHTIDNLDGALIYLLAERFRCTEKIGALKAAHHLPPTDPAREAAQTARLRAQAEKAGLAPERAERIFRAIVQEVIVRHKQLAAPEQRGP